MTNPATDPIHPLVVSWQKANEDMDESDDWEAFHFQNEAALDWAQRVDAVVPSIAQLTVSEQNQAYERLRQLLLGAALLTDTQAHFTALIAQPHTHALIETSLAQQERYLVNGTQLPSDVLAALGLVILREDEAHGACMAAFLEAFHPLPREVLYQTVIAQTQKAGQGAAAVFAYALGPGGLSWRDCARAPGYGEQTLAQQVAEVAPYETLVQGFLKARPATDCADGATTLTHVLPYLPGNFSMAVAEDLLPGAAWAAWLTTPRGDWPERGGVPFEGTPVDYLLQRMIDSFLDEPTEAPWVMPWGMGGWEAVFPTWLAQVMPTEGAPSLDRRAHALRALVGVVEAVVWDDGIADIPVMLAQAIASHDPQQIWPAAFPHEAAYLGLTQRLAALPAVAEPLRAQWSAHRLHQETPAAPARARPRM